MKAFVVVATKERPKETFQLLNSLAGQTYPLEGVIVVASDASDVAGLESHPLIYSKKASIEITDPGLTIQRNVGLDYIMHLHQHRFSPADWFVIFFDDDFRFTTNWVEECAKAFQSNPNLIGLGGQLLADGNMGASLSESEADGLLNQETPPHEHSWSGNVIREVPYLYGCNMAYRGSFAFKERFDENLPFCGWLEDVDYSVRASRKGDLIYLPTAIGVHLGVPASHIDGIQFGYLQISNPLYLLKKDTLTRKIAYMNISRNIATNLFRAIKFNQSKDYKSRLCGNLLAFLDLIKRKCRPSKVKSL